ncbi:ELMO/CED-12 family protein isoform 3 [Artemisia annua]|uniref:ELMO/CED-12 family protein isoform 3 n=1 Tax=Artemisia annua TaxID=35608 RepID=A0A2U1QMW5_ARTAN|nr:ELMO/CED-12 family protein isoform 3 [Artemisia annua]
MHKSFQDLLRKQEGDRSMWEYPFAVAGVNITFMLIKMLDLEFGSINAKCSLVKPDNIPSVLSFTNISLDHVSEQISFNRCAYENTKIHCRLHFLLVQSSNSTLGCIKTILLCQLISRDTRKCIIDCLLLGTFVGSLVLSQKKCSGALFGQFLFS